MIKKEKLDKISNYLIERSNADEALIVITATESYLTRFANSSIHQNVGEENLNITLQVVNGKRNGVALTNNFSNSSLNKLIRDSNKISKNERADEDYKGLPPGEKINYIEKYDKKTGRMSPMKRAKIVSKIINKCNKNGLNASGSFSNGTRQILVKSTSGADCYIINSYADLVLIPYYDDDRTGYINLNNYNFENIDLNNELKNVIKKVKKQKDKLEEIEPGEYTVILEEEAVADILHFFSYLGFNGKLYQEKSSPFSGKLNQNVFGANVSIYDDYSHNEFAGMPFDYEGAERQKLNLVEDGVLKNVAYCSYLAGKYNVKNTGHSPPPPANIFAMPVNIVFRNGNDNIEDMIKSTVYGILITRFHYTNVVNPMQMVITGLTRDGTFLIKNGKIKYGIHNMRFTQNMFDAFNNILQIAERTKKKGNCICPAIKIKKFRFTGKSKI
jgi:predicted Zn-dependent protease